MKKQLTNVRTFLQFSQYGIVKQTVFNGNKLMAMNVIKRMYGVKQFSIIQENITDCYLIEGDYSTN